MRHENVDHALDKAARLYFRLLDLSRDVDRNRDDAAHHEGGGKIWYVFDATVLEVFINAHDQRGSAASLHASEWGVAPSRSYTAQTALCCAEYLLGGMLPGQHRGAIYMTEWHRWEFKRRVEKLQGLQIRRLRTAEPAKLKGRFSAIKRLLERLDKDPLAHAVHIEDVHLRNDLDEFKTKLPDPEEFKAFLSTRLSLEMLAADQLLEPANQLKRLVTAPMRHAFSTLHLALSPQPIELDAIKADAEHWMELLQRECARRGIKVVKSGSEDEQEHASVRHERALSNDAYSLALVRWAARKKARTVDERVVFVTADSIVFDTYRRWFAELQISDPAYSEPFFLRRLMQYAPIFNLVSSGRLEGEQYRELFQDLQNVLEKISAPLNLSLLSKRSSPIIDRMLELTALRVNDPRVINSDIAYHPLVRLLHSDLSNYKEDLNQIIKRWQHLERAALGRAGDAMQQRIQTAHAADEFLLSLDPKSSNDAYERFISDLVQSLVTGPQDVSLHMAREYLNSWPHIGRVVGRAPIALRVEVETHVGTIDIGERLDRRLAGELKGDFLEDEREWHELYAQPALLFAIASAHCVASNDWTNAQQFVEIALTEDTDPDVNRFARARGDQLAEIKYLAALVYRFRMGEIGPPLTGESFGRLSRFYRLANRHIDWCEAYHLASDVHQPLRLIRVRSERAALRLFYASALTSAVRMAFMRRHSVPGGPKLTALAEVDAAGDRLPDLHADRRAMAALIHAEADLLLCLEAVREVQVEHGSARADFLGKLERQYTTNIGAAAALRVLWQMDPEDVAPQLRPGNHVSVRAAHALLSSVGDDAPIMMRADLLTYLALSGDVEAAERLNELPRIELVPGNLSLDAAFVDAIRQNEARFRRLGEYHRNRTTLHGLSAI